MSRIPHTRRLNGRYVFRRRLHYRNLISKPLSMALRTADPKAARERAAMLAAGFAATKSSVDAMLEDGRRLTGTEIEALFRMELERQLQFYVHSAYEDESWSSSVPDVASSEAEAYRIAQLLDRPCGPTDADFEEAERKGFPQIEIRDYVSQILDNLDDQSVVRYLNRIGTVANPRNIRTARTHLLRGGLSACMRATRVFDDNVLIAPDPFQALISDILPVSAEVERLLSAQSVARPAEPSDSRSLFMVHDPRPFSAIIEEVIGTLRAEGVWKGDLKQQRRIMETFAWITGDKPLGDYTHLDAAAFKQGIQRLPKSFRFGSAQEGPMSLPFCDAMTSLAPLGPEDRRNPKTINRDLSTMATVAKTLAQTSWKPAVPGATIMDFGGARITVKIDPDMDTRPPWTRAHLEILFASPIYTGGGDALHRLRQSDTKNRVWHDAAYFLPLLWYYHHTCREEMCGLEIEDIVLDHTVPHFMIRDNRTRGRDGEKAGEKRRARRRTLPLHPELLRLGFADYVEAIAREGHIALFPELYLNAEKRGGAHFYERAWQHMVDYIAARMPLPVNSAGKGPDIHSLRALGSSFYEVDGVNENMRADIMGHARASVNGKHYSKRLATEGLTVVLNERRDFICRYVPSITGEIVPWQISLLPLEQRARVGSSAARKRRSDARRPSRTTEQ